jgi:DNA polymerase-4
VDITGSKQFGSPLQIAEELQTRIYNELQLPCSIGIAPNKLLAKMASDMKKPNGLFVLRLRDVQALLWNKPCQMLYGIGAKTADKLKVLGILTIGELASADDLLLSTHFGIMGDVLKQAANGYDDSKVNPESGASKSVGHTTTLPANLTDLSAMKKVLLNVADGVGRRLRKQKLMASTVQLTIRDPHMKTITRSVTLEICIDNTEDLYKYACHLLEKNWTKGRAVRLLGITAQNLLFKEDAVVQMDLFEYEKHPRKELLHETIDRLRDKYGEGSIVTAGMISDDPSSLIRNHKLRGTSLQMDHMKGRSLDTEDAP